jgi:hypothetical protein
MKKLAILSILLFVFLPASHALGCVCFKRTPKQLNAERLGDLSKAKVVFAGEVISLDTFRVKFRVDRLWKGQQRKEITMVTGAIDNGNGTVTTTTCDYVFKKGQIYLVWAYGPPERLRTDTCTRTALSEYAKTEMKALDDLTRNAAPGKPK